MKLLRIAIAFAAAAATLAAQTPIKHLPYVIEKPGSYVLTRGADPSLGGIFIDTSHVSINLAGFALTGLPGSGDGILVRGSQSDIEIRNGTITGWGGSGIDADDAMNVVLEDLRVSGNGLAGVRAGIGAVVEDLVLQSNGCSGLIGFDALLARDVVATGNAGWGIEAGTGAFLADNVIMGNFGGGVFVAGYGRVTGNSVVHNGHLPEGAPDACSTATKAGILVSGSGMVVADNLLASNFIGLQLPSGGNRVVDNVVRDNATNYELGLGNELELLVSELPLKIEWPALVKLSGSLTGARDENGLIVASDGVTIDLGGHALLGSPDGGVACGILVEGEFHGLTVKNGHVRNWSACGINAKTAQGAKFEDLVLEGNGVQGLTAGDGAVIRDLVARANLVDGVHTGTDCMVLSSSFTANGNDGLQLGDHSQVINSVASENYLFGIRAGLGAMVRDTTASHNNLGIAVVDGSSVERCTASYNELIGIRAERASVVTGNVCEGNETGIAIVAGPGTKVTHNNVTSGVTGLLLADAGNLAFCNSASGNVDNYVFVPGNAVATINDVAGNPAFWVTDAWANLSF